MDSEETRSFYEKRVRDLALTEVLRWGFTTGNLNQEALDGIAENMARRYIELTVDAGEIIEVDEFGSATDNCVHIVTTVFSRLGVSDIAAVKVVDNSVHAIIDEESCYLNRDALRDLERAFPQVCLYPKFLEVILTEFLPECHKGKIVTGGEGYVKKEAGVCNVIFEVSE